MCDGPPRLVSSVLPVGMEKGDASHQGCCKTLRLNILDVFRPATPFHLSAHPFLSRATRSSPVGRRGGRYSTTTADRLRRKILFFFFFSLFYSLAPARINGPFFSLSFVPSIGFLSSAFPPPVFEPCPGGNPCV